MNDSFPATIGDMQMLHWSPIDARHTVTGACRHFNLSTGCEDPVPSVIAIVTGGADQFFLMQFNSDLQFITDTCHETLDEAFSQAEFEYKGISATWQVPNA